MHHMKRVAFAAAALTLAACSPSKTETADTAAMSVPGTATTPGATDSGMMMKDSAMMMKGDTGMMMKDSAMMKGGAMRKGGATKNP